MLQIILFAIKAYCYKTLEKFLTKLSLCDIINMDNIVKYIKYIYLNKNILFLIYFQY